MSRLSKTSTREYHSEAWYTHFAHAIPQNAARKYPGTWGFGISQPFFSLVSLEPPSLLLGSFVRPVLESH